MDIVAKIFRDVLGRFKFEWVFISPFLVETILKDKYAYLSCNFKWFSLVFIFLGEENVAGNVQLLSPGYIWVHCHSLCFLCL